jgi:hypothetical protein
MSENRTRYGIPRPEHLSFTAQVHFLNKAGYPENAGVETWQAAYP